MTSLVERLRNGVYGTNRITLCDKAADVIEALEEAVRAALPVCDCAGNGLISPGSRDAVAKLKAALVLLHPDGDNEQFN